MTRTIPNAAYHAKDTPCNQDYTCTVVPFPCDELIKQAAKLTSDEFAHFAKEVGALRRLNNNDIDETALTALVGE